MRSLVVQTTVRLVTCQVRLLLWRHFKSTRPLIFPLPLSADAPHSQRSDGPARLPGAAGRRASISAVDRRPRVAGRTMPGGDGHRTAHDGRGRARSTERAAPGGRAPNRDRRGPRLTRVGGQSHVRARGCFGAFGGAREIAYAAVTGHQRWLLVKFHFGMVNGLLVKAGSRHGLNQSGPMIASGGDCLPIF